ncbi:MAG: FAD-dependent oxidoreductase, partial [Oscillospiraceae bacterium]|nr:FAD-dependent oxidoreductase [Oscillospiraceae bacterium]
DEIAFGGWSLDDHFPGGFYHKGRPNTNIPTAPHYSIPYRALYSKNVENLFFAGRNISMTHTAMSSIRVMATCTLLGEAVGKAAAIAVENSCAPHDVYLSHLSDLQKRLQCEDCFLPSRRRTISEICKKSSLNTKCEYLRNGEDRAHIIYKSEKSEYCAVNCGESSEYSFPKNEVKNVHIVFDSDLNRETLPGGIVESRHITRANVRLDVPVMHMPKTLCREFSLYGEIGGERIELLKVGNNRKRAYDIKIGKELDKLILIPQSSWGESCAVSVISFDFE